jgi:hypothetical protein
MLSLLLALGTSARPKLLLVTDHPQTPKTHSQFLALLDSQFEVVRTTSS